MISDIDRYSEDSELAAHWAAERCPVIDGIIFGDGRIKPMLANWRQTGDGTIQLVVEPGESTTLNELRPKKPIEYTGIIVLCSAEDPVRRIQIIGGEGGLGADGFVAALRVDSHSIVWIAFFTNSNPFELVQINDGIVLAKTNLNIWWRFPLDDPARVTLQ